MRWTIRDEEVGDHGAVAAIHADAFGQPQEGDLVDALRSKGAALVSLVAVADEQVIGHILYSPVVIHGNPALSSQGEGGVSTAAGSAGLGGAGLAPMAVLSEYQNQGIGSSLVKAGNQALRDSGCPFVVVLGHPEYYPRFGFEPASRHGLRCEWDVPDDVFMVLDLDKTQQSDLSGLAKYRAECSSVA